MRCPKCTKYMTDRVKTGEKKFDYLIACVGCSWQVLALELNTWLKRWRG